MSMHRQRALVLREQSRFDLAERELRLALADAPDDPGLHLLLAECLCELKRFEEGLAEASEAAHLVPDDAASHSLRSWALSGLERHEEAALAAREAIRIEPEAVYFGQLANSLRHRRLYLEALRSADEGLSLDAENPSCLNERALNLMNLDRNTEALLAVETMLRLDPEDAHAHAAIGYLLPGAEDRTKKVECFREALRLQPGSKWLSHALMEQLYIQAWQLAQDRQPHDAMSSLQEAARIDPEWPWFVERYLSLFGSINEILLDQAQSQPAVEYFLQTEALFPKVDWYRTELLRGLVQVGRRLLNQDTAKALECFRHAARMDPKLAWVRAELIPTMSAEDADAVVGANDDLALARLRAAFDAMEHPYPMVTAILNWGFVFLAFTAGIAYLLAHR